MKIPKKTYTYISSKIYHKYYIRSKYMKKFDRYFWERNSCMPIFMVNKTFWIHKGMHFRKKRIEYYHMSSQVGVFTLTRKPFTPPIKRVKDKRKRIKRVGKVKHEQSGPNGSFQSPL